MHSFTILSCLYGIFWLLRHFGHILAAVVIVCLLPVFAVFMLADSVVTLGMGVMAWIDAGAPASWLVAKMISMVFSALAVAAGIFVSHALWNGMRLEIGGILAAARRALPILLVYNIVMIMMSEFLMMGSFLLAAIGAIGFICLTIVFFPIPAVAVLEQHSILGSFARAAQISSGHRWRITALIMVPLLPIVVLAFVAAIYGWPLARHQTELTIIFIVCGTMFNVALSYVTCTLILTDRGERGPPPTADLFD